MDVEDFMWSKVNVQGEGHTKERGKHEHRSLGEAARHCK